MDDNLNAFDQGVADGGLRNTSQIKLLIEYLVNSLGGFVAEETVIQAMTVHYLANYFEITQAINELFECGNLEKNEAGSIKLTDRGKTNLRELIGDLPVSVRETALKDGREYQKREKNKQTNTTEIRKTEKGYNVTVTINHGTETLMSLTVYTPDRESAQDIQQRFADSPEEIYSKVLSILYD